MTLEELAWFIKTIDDLTDRDFETLYNILHLRAMRRAQARYPKPQDKEENGTHENQNDHL